jgi:hypothetical protein
LSHGAELGGKIGMGEKKSHEKKGLFVSRISFERKPEI